MSYTDWYIDPLNGDDDIGDGTSEGSAWQTLQYAVLNYITTSSDGDVLNIKNNANIELTADLDWSNVGSTADTGFKIRGYSTSIQDGGRATIDLKSYVLKPGSSSSKPLFLQDLIIVDTVSSNNYIRVHQYSGLINCKLSAFSGVFVQSSYYVTIQNCEFTDSPGYCINLASTSDNVYIYGNHFYNSGSNIIDRCINLANSARNIIISHNIFNLSSTSDAVIASGGVGAGPSRIDSNTFYTTGTGEAFRQLSQLGTIINNNIFEGWSTAVDTLQTFGGAGSTICNNHFYNNSTDIDATTYTAFNIDEGNILNAGESVLSKTGSNIHANRFIYFMPTGDAIERAFDGSNDIGAVKGAGGSGGGGIIKASRMTGGVN